MYCVRCGIFLNDENQEGIVCHGCKQMQRENRSIRGLVVDVQCCYYCGQPYHPADASILHVTCFAGGMNERIVCSLLHLVLVCAER